MMRADAERSAKFDEPITIENASGPVMIRALGYLIASGAKWRQRPVWYQSDSCRVL